MPKKSTTKEPKKPADKVEKKETAEKKEKPAKAPRKMAVKKSVAKKTEEAPEVSVAETVQAAAEKKREEVQIEVAKVMTPLRPKLEKYFEAVGRRKRATARVRLYTSNPQNSAEAGNIEVNSKSYKTYFPIERFWAVVEDPLKKLKSMNRFRAIVRVQGGGVHAQAEAIRHGLARALTLFDLNFRKRLKRAGFLKRDPREKERKKYGLKKARRAPQWAKR
jgi:small subunit ribosomal protein S9